MKQQYSFNFWYNNIADIPTRDENGAWYDLETGLPYIDSKNDKKNDSVATNQRKEKKVTTLTTQALRDEDDRQNKIRKDFFAKHRANGLKTPEILELLRAENGNRY